jgi:hypothetical protein
VTYFGREFTGVFPVLQGRLDHLLPERWNAAPRTVTDRVCSLPSYTDALVETVRLLHGKGSFTFADTSVPNLTRVVWLLDGTPDALTKTSPLDRTPEPGQVGCIGNLSASLDDAQDWTSWDPQLPVHLNNRRDLLAGALWKAQVLPWTLDECLSAKTLRMALWRTFLMAGFGLWWQRAIDQGHTVASARTLLALIAEPATLAHIVEWPTDDDPRAGLVVTPRPEGTPRYAPA